MSLPTEETRILLHDGKFVRERIDREVLAPTNLIFAGLREEVPFRIHRLYPLGASVISLYRPPGREAILYTDVITLPLKLAYMTQSGSSLLVPHTTYRNGYADAQKNDRVIDASFKWKELDCGVLRFMVDFSGGYPSECYLFNFHNGTTYVIPYANLFNDGRICMGPEWTANKSGGFDTMVAMFHHAWMAFNTSILNNHLIHPTFNEIYKYNPITNKTEAEGDPGFISYNRLESCPGFLTEWNTV